MAQKVLISLLLLTTTMLLSNCELFTAIIDIQRSLQQEQDLATALDEYVSAELRRISRIKVISDNLKKSSLKQHNVTDLTHPIHAYLMLRRLGIDWQKYVGEEKDQTHDSFKNQISNLSLPSNEDIDGAMDAIVRLQDTYALSARLLSAGKLKHGVNYSSIMSADECFGIAYFAYSKGDLYHTADWLTVTLDLMGNSTSTAMGLRRSKVLDYLAYVQYKQGHTREALALTNELLLLEPDHDRAAVNRHHFERLLAAEATAKGARKGDAGTPDSEEALKHNSPHHREGWYASPEFLRYKRLCRGDRLEGRLARQFNATASSDAGAATGGGGRHPPLLLLCRYHRPHPYFYLAPVKEEVANWYPLIVLWHGIISDNEIDAIKRLAEPRLKRATVQDPTSGLLVTARYRISKSAWLQPVHDPLIGRLDRRIDLMTGLSIESAEELQVVNYGLGGHYEPHYDFAHRRESSAFERAQGNRIATLLYYLSDVAAGGATVFTDLALQLWPTKGSAAFWYNLKRNGDGQLLTRHAACPVLHGSKWVMNKWFHERAQEFRRPCSLDRDE